MIIEKSYTLEEAVHKREVLTSELNLLLLQEQKNIQESNKVDLKTLSQKFEELVSMNKTIEEKKKTASLKEKKCCKWGSWCGSRPSLGTVIVLGVNVAFTLASVGLSVYVYNQQNKNHLCNKSRNATLAELISNVVSAAVGGLVLEGIREINNQKDQDEILKKIEGVRDQGEQNMSKILQIFEQFKEEASKTKLAFANYLLNDLKDFPLGDGLSPDLWTSHLLDKLSEKDPKVKKKMSSIKKEAKLLKQTSSVLSQKKSIKTEFESSTIHLHSSDEGSFGEKNAFSLSSPQSIFEKDQKMPIENHGFKSMWEEFQKELGLDSLPFIKVGNSVVTNEGEISKVKKSSDTTIIDFKQN